eukprot:4502504-Prymnesium_polylepis.1
MPARNAATTLCERATPGGPTGAFSPLRGESAEAGQVTSGGWPLRAGECAAPSPANRRASFSGDSRELLLDAPDTATQRRSLLERSPIIWQSVRT